MACSLQVHWSTEQRVEEGLSSGICHRKRWKCEQRWHRAYILQGNDPEILKKLLVKSTFWLVLITYFFLQDGCLLGMNICNFSLFTLWNTNVDFLLPESAHNNTIAVDPRRCENVVWFENTKGTLPRVLRLLFCSCCILTSSMMFTQQWIHSNKEFTEHLLVNGEFSTSRLF